MALLLVFAHQSEAQVTIQLLDAKKISLNTYIFSNGWIVISGIGILPAMLAITTFKHMVSEIWNVGFAGALNDIYALGEIKKIQLISKLNFLPENLDSTSIKISNNIFPNISLSEAGVRLITSDFPLHDKKQKKNLSSKWDLVDMEGYGVAQAALKMHIPCKMWKIVSDFVSPEGRLFIKQNIFKLSELLAKQITMNLSEL